MHITGMTIGGIPPFTEPVKFEFDERVNVFIGPNSTGKSTLLREIEDALNPGRSIEYRTHWISAGSDDDADYFIDHGGILVISQDWHDVFFGIDKTCQNPPVICFGPSRTGVPEISSGEHAVEDESTANEILSREYSGANLVIATNKLHDKAERMYIYERSNDLKAGERKAGSFLHVDRIAHACAKSICQELVMEDRVRNYVTGVDVQTLVEQPMANLDNITIRRSLGIRTIDVPNFDNVKPEEKPTYHGAPEEAPLYVGHLSSGTQLTLLWIRWLAYKMLDHYDFARGWEKEPAILLIDEIENHLHPTWQRRVIPALLEHFPGLQIFATTHSPFVVAGLKAGQVHMLQRDANGVITASTNERDIIGWTTDEILRTFMGVDEPTDQLTIDRANRLRELRSKDELSPEEEEELQQLRRQVNEDFMTSSTPLETQRERYGDMMLDFLRSRQSELSQDGN